MDFWEERSGGNAAKTAFFSLQSSVNPLGNCLSKRVKNCQFFIFRKNKPKLTSYFKMSKKTHSWPNLSSFEVAALKTAVIPIYQLNVLERTSEKYTSNEIEKNFQILLTKLTTFSNKNNKCWFETTIP